MRNQRFFFGVGLLLALCGLTRADDSNVINCTESSQALQANFGTYGPSSKQAIFFDGEGAHFRLPVNSGKTGQIGLHSHFSLSGDFEVSTDYKIWQMPTPREGYGVKFGIALETDGSIGGVSIARGYLPKGGDVIIVTRSQRGKDGKMGYKSTTFPTGSKMGKLMLRREGKDILFFVADRSPKYREIQRMEFTDGTIRKMRIYADPGKSPAEFDFRLSQLKVKAEEATGGIPEKERSSNWWIWVGGIVVLALIGGGAYLTMRKKHNREAVVEA